MLKHTQLVDDDDVIVHISDVSFVYPGSEQSVLNGASLTIQRGSFTAIIGGNGCGKSTLCKLFNGLIPHYYSGDYAGTVEICGLSTEEHSVAELSRKVGYVYQDFDNQLVRPTVLDEALFAPLNYGLADYRSMGLRALEMCGLTHLKERYIWELSGGQKHLLALAGALSLEPDILVVDEPVSQLDPQHARQVYEVLRQLNQVYGKTIIVIEHHTEFIADYCHEVCLMEKGKVLWKRPVVEALNSLEDLERLGIQPPEVTKAAVHLSAALTKHHESTGRVANLGTEASLRTLFPYPVTAESAEKYFGELLHFYNDSSLTQTLHEEQDLKQEDPNPAERYPTSPVIQFNQTRLSYRTIRRAEHEVLRGIDLSLYEGERIALVGNNGAGKSSLMKLIAGIAKPSKGTVSVMGQSTKDLSIEQLSSNVAFVFQNPEDMFIEDNVHKEVAYCLKSRRYPDAEAKVNQMLHNFRLMPLKDRDARLLSGGQQRRVSLAIGAAIMPKVILLDEPTANLDLATREELLGTLQELEEHVRTVIIATHDMQLVHQWATRVIVMNEGTVAGDGTVDEIFSDAALIEKAGLAPTQMMDLSVRLGMNSSSSSPERFAQQMYRILTGKENPQDAACPQLG